jgi:hypothetical protein
MKDKGTVSDRFPKPEHRNRIDGGSSPSCPADYIVKGRVTVDSVLGYEVGQGYGLI